MQQYVIFNVLKEYCIPKEEEEEDRDWRECKDRQLWVEIDVLVDRIHTTQTTFSIQSCRSRYAPHYLNRNYSAILVALQIK